MAEMEVKGSGSKRSTRVDLTPMVDLGFLLITFFMFTTTMASPTAMDLFMPKDTEKPQEQNKIKESGALSLILGKQDNVYYYEGQLKDPNNFKVTSFKGIRDIIIQKKSTTDSTDFVIVIKPSNDATYKNTVDILDEMTINEVKRFAIVDVDKEELKLMGLVEKANGIK